MSTPSVKSILVTTDLSQESATAYPYARLLAQSVGATVKLVTFLDTSVQMGIGGPFDMPVVYVPEAISEIKSKAERDLSSQVTQHFAGLNATCEVRESVSAIHYAIIDYINEIGFDMVVMASHGRSGIARTVMGSVAEQVLRRSGKPVLVVPVSRT